MHTYTHLSIHLLMRLFLPFGYYNADMNILCTSVCGNIMFLILSCMYLRVAGISWTFWGTVVFQSSSTILHSREICVKVPVSLHAHQRLLLSVFVIAATLVDVRWQLTVILICGSLMFNVMGYFLVCSSTICAPFWSNVYVKLLPIFS